MNVSPGEVTDPVLNECPDNNYRLLIGYDVGFWAFTEAGDDHHYVFSRNQWPWKVPLCLTLFFHTVLLCCMYCLTVSKPSVHPIKTLKYLTQSFIYNLACVGYSSARHFSRTNCLLISFPSTISRVYFKNSFPIIMESHKAHTPSERNSSPICLVIEFFSCLFSLLPKSVSPSMSFNCSFLISVVVQLCWGFGIVCWQLHGPVLPFGSALQSALKSTYALHWDLLIYCCQESLLRDGVMPFWLGECCAIVFNHSFFSLGQIWQILSHLRRLA